MKKKMRKLLTTTTIILAICSAMVGQNLPTTNLYMFDIQKESDSLYLFKNPKFLSNFNSRGYNNQPAFMSENELYITVGIPGEGQTDIYKLDLKNNTRMQVTRTKESEYSPTLMPDANNFSSVRVELDGKQSQRLWSFPFSRSNNGKPFFPGVTNIGYHYWLDNYRVALFIVGEPAYLAVGDVRDGSIQDLTTDIGRGFQTSPAGNLAYIHKATESTWYIKEMNNQTLRSRIIAPTLAGSEDFCVLADGTILMGRGYKLYKYHPKKDTEWLEIGDFRYYGINAITRLAVNSKGKLVLVGS